jgi:prefoldin alpha subunit
MNEQELQKAMAALEQFRAQLEGLAENMQLIQITLEELARAKETLTQYQNTAEGAELLVPIGGNSFVFARVASNTKAIVGVGSQISVEKNMDQAIKIMDDRFSELGETLGKLSARRATLEEQASLLSRSVQQEYQSMQQMG